MQAVKPAGPACILQARALVCRREHVKIRKFVYCRRDTVKVQSESHDACMLCMFVRARPAAQEAARPRPVQAAGPLASPAAGRSRKLHGRSHLHEHDFQKRIQHTCHEKLQHACLHALHASVGPACVPSGGVGTACRRVHPCIHIWMNRHVCLREFKIRSSLWMLACVCVASARAANGGVVAAGILAACTYKLHAYRHEHNCIR